VRIGIYVLPNRPWHELEERWRRVEELGFDSLWDCDVLSWPGAPQEPCFDGLVVLAGMAARTSRVRVGTLVLSLPIRNNPAVLAKQVVALDHLSGERLEFGFGGGYVESDHLGAGGESWDKQERVDRFREAVELMDRALRQEVTTYVGRYYRTKDLRSAPGAVQRPRPPLVVPAHSAAMLLIAAQYADTWNSYGGFVDSEEEIFRRTRDRCLRLDDLCEELGRDPRSIGRSLLVFQTSGHYEGAPKIHPWVSVESVRERVGLYRGIGITELVFYYPDTGADAQVMERVAVDVLPELGPRANRSSFIPQSPQDGPL